MSMTSCPQMFRAHRGPGRRDIRAKGDDLSNEQPDGRADCPRPRLLHAAAHRRLHGQ